MSDIPEEITFIHCWFCLSLYSPTFYCHDNKMSCQDQSLSNVIFPKQTENITTMSFIFISLQQKNVANLHSMKKFVSLPKTLVFQTVWHHRQCLNRVLSKSIYQEELRDDFWSLLPRNLPCSLAFTNRRPFIKFMSSFLCRIPLFVYVWSFFNRLILPGNISFRAASRSRTLINSIHERVALYK